MTYKEFLESFLPYQKDTSLEERIWKRIDAKDRKEIYHKLEWLGLFSDSKIEAQLASPAQILQEILEKKWKLNPSDRDMVIMQHQLEYQLGNKFFKTTSSISILGDNANSTAMAKTVGLPLGIVAKLILENKIKQTGVQIPVTKELYQPILEELEEYGICFKHKTIELKGAN